LTIILIVLNAMKHVGSVKILIFIIAQLAKIHNNSQFMVLAVPRTAKRAII